jgi:hypothetical protein
MTQTQRSLDGDVAILKRRQTESSILENYRSGMLSHYQRHSYTNVFNGSDSSIHVTFGRIPRDVPGVRDSIARKELVDGKEHSTSENQLPKSVAKRREEIASDRRLPLFHFDNPSTRKYGSIRKDVISQSKLLNIPCHVNISTISYNEVIEDIGGVVNQKKFCFKVHKFEDDHGFDFALDQN